MKGHFQAYRIAYRHEGDMWNVYLAQPGTMEGSFMIGSLHMGLASNEALRAAYIEFFSLAMKDINLSAFGHPGETMDPVPAPQHEKAGHG